MTKNKSKHFLMLSLVLFCVTFSHAQTYTNGKGLTYKGRSYATVVMGNGQEWMAENLSVFYFRNGDSIPVVKTEEAWKKAGKNGEPACCYYENNAEYGKTYGLLYNWYAVNDPRGLAPDGWHVPTNAEWTVLTNYLGAAETAGGKMKSTGTQYWQSPNTDATNESGFLGLPGGYRNDDDGTFYGIGRNGCWWSSTEYGTSDAWNRPLNDYDGVAASYVNTKTYGFSVRCLRD